MMYFIVGVTVLLIFSMTGCGGVSHKSPEKVTEELINAYANGKEKKVSIPDSEFRGCFYKYQMDFFNKFRSAFPKATAFELMPEAGRALQQIMEFNRIDS